MSVFTVHEPPLRAADSVADPERFMFVRDGFYFWAFALTPLWMIWHRMWLVLLIYLIVAVGADSALHYAGIGSGSVVVVELLISFLVGFEASTLRRFTLARRGWKNVGVVAGDGVDAAERRFFDAWAAAANRRRRAADRCFGRPPPPSTPRTPQPSGIIGLFPEPGALR